MWLQNPKKCREKERPQSPPPTSPGGEKGFSLHQRSVLLYLWKWAVTFDIEISQFYNDLKLGAIEKQTADDNVSFCND